MAKLSREIKTGLVALSTIAIFIWGFSFLKGSNLLENKRVFYAEYDNVQGLSKSAPVTINGLKVGTVDEIYFHPTNPGILVVKFSLENTYKFSKGSIAQIYSPDFISGKSIKILTSFSGPEAVSKDTLRGNIEAGFLGAINDQIAPLQTKFSNFILNTDSLVMGMNAIFDAKTQTNLKQSVAKLNKTLGSFESASSDISQMLSENKGKFDSIIDNADNTSQNLSNLTDSLSAANLGGSIKKLETTLTKFNSVLAAIDNGEGSLGKLLKDDGLYNNLKGASKEMEELLKEMKLNPKRFVHFSLFGKKPKPYTQEEGQQE